MKCAAGASKMHDEKSDRSENFQNSQHRPSVEDRLPTHGHNVHADQTFGNHDMILRLNGCYKM